MAVAAYAITGVIIASSLTYAVALKVASIKDDPRMENIPKINKIASAFIIPLVLLVPGLAFGSIISLLAYGAVHSSVIALTTLFIVATGLTIASIFRIGASQRHREFPL